MKVINLQKMLIMICLLYTSDNKFDSLIGIYFEYEEIKNKIAELNIKDDFAKKLIEI